MFLKDHVIHISLHDKLIHNSHLDSHDEHLLKFFFGRKLWKIERIEAGMSYRHRETSVRPVAMLDALDAEQSSLAR